LLAEDSTKRELSTEATELMEKRNRNTDLKRASAKSKSTLDSSTRTLNSLPLNALKTSLRKSSDTSKKKAIRPRLLKISTRSRLRSSPKSKHQ